MEICTIFGMWCDYLSTFETRESNLNIQLWVILFFVFLFFYTLRTIISLGFALLFQQEQNIYGLTLSDHLHRCDSHKNLFLNFLSPFSHQHIVFCIEYYRKMIRRDESISILFKLHFHSIQKAFIQHTLSWNDGT